MRESAPGAIDVAHEDLGDYRLWCDGAPELLFTENESNAQRLWGQANASPYVKDAFHDYVISGQREAVNPDKVGTKAAAHYIARRARRAGARRSGCDWRAVRSAIAFGGFEAGMDRRIADADEFYERITPPRRSTRISDASTARPWRACSGRSSTTTSTWTTGCASTTVIRSLNRLARGARNTEWFHMLNSDVISMPDKWEYPWYAAWDLAFHTRGAGDGGFRFRQGPAPADAAQPLLPPERADSGLRVELQRCQSPGACLGHALSLQSASAALAEPTFASSSVRFRG